MASSKNGAVLAILGAGLLYSGLAPVSAEVDFARDIRPILNAKCTGCHGGVKQAGGISFVYKNQFIGFEGESGNPVVVPGEPEKSEMFYRITTDDEDDAMPPRRTIPKVFPMGRKNSLKTGSRKEPGGRGIGPLSHR